MPKPTAVNMPTIPAAELGGFLGRLARYEGRELTRLAVRFTLLTWARTTEVRFAPRASEFSGLDSDEPLWRIRRPG